MPHLRDGFYLADPDIEELRRHLTRVTTIVDNYAITLTSQDRVRPPALGGKTGKAKLEEMCPLNVEARDRLDRLANELGTVARDICETRGITWKPVDSLPHGFVGPLPLGWRRLPRDYQANILDVARWLRVNVIALALMPAAEELRDGIVKAIDRCLDIVDLPTERSVVIDRDRIAAANRQVVTADAAERIAGRLGELGKGRTAARVRLLRKKGHIAPCSTDKDSGAHFYRLGEVLDAHHRIERRVKLRA
jgi:hypothetical protein